MQLSRNADTPIADELVSFAVSADPET